MQESGFTRKKVNSLTLGERLIKLRREQGLTLSEVAQQTKIQLKYLECIEKGEYDKLPTEVYVKGFLRSYAKVLSIKEESLIKFYKKDRAIQKNINQADGKENVIQKPIKYSRFIITPKVIIFVTVTVLILLSFFYLLRELQHFLATPYLVIDSPADGIEVSEKFLEVLGKTEKESELFINDQKILIDKEGNFKENINLQKGLNVISVRSINRFGKESTKTVAVNGAFEDNQSLLEESLLETDFNSSDLIGGNDVFLLEVSVLDDDVWLLVEADGNVVFSGLIGIAEAKTFEAVQEFKVTSGMGDKTLIKLNGEDNGMLSQKEGLIKDVVFENEVEE